MPQLHLTDIGPSQMRDLRITISPPNAVRHSLQVVIAVERGNQTAPFPCWVGSLPGLESDFLMTLVKEATSAWAFGEDARDVQRACISVKKQAREHAAQHEF